MELGTPLKPSVLNLTAEEIEWMEGLIAQKLLPDNWFELCDHAATVSFSASTSKSTATARRLNRAWEVCRI
jgi:hypothetical protein